MPLPLPPPVAYSLCTQSQPPCGLHHAPTGDIPDEWIRDGSVQLAVYLPRMSEHPVLRPVIEGAIRTQVRAAPHLY